MATYEVTDPATGRKLRLTGDSPPTEQELEQVFQSSGGAEPEEPLGVGGTLKGVADVAISSARGIVNRPSASMAGLVGALNPNDTYIDARDRARADIATDTQLVKDDRLRTREGERVAETVAGLPGVRHIAAGLDWVGDKIEETVGPEARDFAGSAAELIALRAPRVAHTPPKPAAPTRAGNARAVIAEGEKHGVPVFYDDVTDSAMARRVGVAAEQLGPLGTGSGRAAQAEAAQTAANRVVQSRTPSVADDVPLLVQKGLKTKLDQFRAGSNRLYERVGVELDPLGNLPTPGLQGAIRAGIQAEGARGTLANQNLVNMLKKYEQAPAGNFTAMRQMRSDLSDDIAEYYTGNNATIGEKGVRSLQALKSALDADMASFAQQSGTRGYNAWRMADGHYRANIVPFREAGFRDLVKTAEPEKAWRYLLAQGGLKSRAERMYRSLDETGRGAVRYGMVKDALDLATSERGTFSPAKFAKYLEDHSNTVNTFFKGAELQEIKGFQNLMRHVERAGQFAENPPTGQRLIPYLMGGAAMIQPGVAATVAGAGLGTRALFQTRTGRNLLLGMSRAKQGSQAAERIAQRITAYVAAGAAAGSSVDVGTSPEAATPQE